MNNMINKTLSKKIWTCHNEIEKSELLLKEMSETYDDNTDNYELKDTWGKGQRLQIGVPMGSDRHRLYDVDYKLARKIIKKHIKKKKKKLRDLMNETKKVLYSPKIRIKPPSKPRTKKPIS